MNNFPKSFFVLAMGFFAITSQTLLFREFITSFESNDIAVALFFGSWFLWIAVSAWLFGQWKSVAVISARYIKILLLFYIPAFILQLILILQAREIAGIASYSLFPIKSMLLMAAVVNFPVSFMTGILFPAACRWLTENNEIPVSKVYLLEAVGSVSGGLAVTIMLYFEFNCIMIFLLSTLLISIAVYFVSKQESNKSVPLNQGRNAMVTTGISILLFKPNCLLLVPALIIIMIAGRMDKPIIHQIQEIKWTKLLPASTYKGSFATAQGEYLYGYYNEQWIIVRDGAVCTSLPDKETAAETIAINLCQQPEAENILVIGSGINLCDKLSESFQIKHISWFLPDPKFIEKVNAFIPEASQVNNKKVTFLKDDIRTFLRENKQPFDAVIINLPNPESSSLNRYFTVEFFELIRKNLSRNGVVGVQISGGENVIGAELAYIGASVKETLKNVFPKIVIKAGEITWFIASENEEITDNPQVLSKNFAKFAGAEKIFPPTGLYSLYLPERSADAWKIYNSVDLPRKLLENRDAEPRVYLYELLLACKQSGINAVRQFRNILFSGSAPFMISALVFMLIWIFYAKGMKDCAGVGENSLLILISGLLGIGTAIVLMFLYQTRYGSLFLYIGLISSLFMIGLSAGAFLARNLTVSGKISNDSLMFWTIPVQVAVFALIAYGGSYEWNHVAFGMAFLLPGFCNGIYFPIAAARLNKTERTSEKAGSMLENADHLGATVGALITGLCLIPILGTRQTLIFFAILMMINIPIALFRIHKNKGAHMTIEPKQPALRKIIFLIIGMVILGATFFLSAKVTAEIPPEKQISEKAKSQQEKKSIEQTLGKPPAAEEEKTEEYVPSEVKEVDLKKIKQMIKEKKLSDHEAEFYKKIE